MRTHSAPNNQNESIGQALLAQNYVNPAQDNARSCAETHCLNQFALDHCPDAVFYINPDGRICYASEQACRTLGYTRAELLSMTIYDIDPNFKNDTWIDHWQVIKERHVLRLESVQRTKTGEIIPVDISTHYVRHGDQEYLCAFAHELSEQRQIERKLREYELRLNMAQRMETLGTLASGIAHDFNNILSSILGFSELALDGMQPDIPLQDNLREIFTAGMRAKELVKQILTFSRPAEQEKQPIQIKLIVKEVLKLLKASMPATIQIRPNIHSDGLVMADPSQLHQIVMNLATNAGHAMQPDGGTLTVDLKEVALGPEYTASHLEIEPGRFIQLTVADTGKGIAPDIMDRIFDPFFTTKKNGEGTGLGLSMVHGIIRDHGGSITVRSEVGQGSEFRVYLPLLQTTRKQVLDKTTSLPTGHEHILLVDDEPAIVKMAAQMLERFGYQVTCCTVSLEALRLFQEQPMRFDLVITDLTMPDLPGQKLALELKKIRPAIPIILCTGYGKEISESKMEEQGITALIMKPIERSTLAKTVRRVLDAAERPNYL